MKITPEYISQLVNFYSNSGLPDWQYDPAGKDMRNLQVLGAAKVFNMLDAQGLALLADEVGMGKTIQALTVCAALWNENPKARVLILAPRDEIAQNWIKEYQTFIRHHYRHNDNVVKTISGHEPVKKMIYCQNLYRLVHEVQQEWGQLFIGKISSFSSLMARRDVIARLEDLGIRPSAKALALAKSRSREMNQELTRLLKKELISHGEDGKPFFDLLIIDEAHYFRHKNGDSLRVNAATEFFGDPAIEGAMPIASKVLLLTATPNHTSSRDIESIISYFTNKFEGKSYKTILEEICVRRLRRLSAKGYNKYNYRNEIPSQSTFRENPLSEIFFGLYQHELAKEVSRKKQERGKGRGVSHMMKYLEGVEFIPFEKNEPADADKEQESNGVSSDFSNGSDADLLLEISTKFRDIFSTAPVHPKYFKLVEDLTTKHQNEKAVVFVRRIPSVFEIAKRMIEHYDRNMWGLFSEYEFGNIPLEKLDRKQFKKYSTAGSELDENSLKNDSEGSEEEGSVPSSKVLNLFKIIKNDAVKSTHAANFRLRFTHSKPSIYSMFFSPGQDYFDAPYEELLTYRYDTAGENLENYYNSALLHRTKKLEDEGLAKDVLSSLLPKNPVTAHPESKDASIPTLLTIFWNILKNDSRFTEGQKALVEGTYLSFTIYEKEAFSNFLEKGTLLASEGLVWLYLLFLKVQTAEDEKGVTGYLKFSKLVEEGLKDVRLYAQISDAILHFRQIYTKEFGINGERMLLEQTWDNFNNAQPIYPYNAANSSKNILKCFNTPFFPDFLVATSVLQEGVNLQYFCNSIYHYGMAWTPGDNEQRIGRIDRMFGKIERELEVSNDAKLHIYYPYLKDTIDEEQLARFVKRKYREEALIDMGKAFEETTEYALEENDNDAWKKFLREPQKDQITTDPFPVNPEDFASLKATGHKMRKYDLHEFYQSISQCLGSLKEFRPEVYFIDQQDEQRILIDPVLPNGRMQPVVVELIYDHIGSGYSGNSVYCLRLKTPLAAFSKYRQIKGLFHSNKKIQSLYHPGIKLCLDPGQTSGNSWGLYMAIELPLFFSDLASNPLSAEELQHAFTSLILCADKAELELFDRDIHKEELNLPAESLLPKHTPGFRAAEQQSAVHKWKTKGDYFIKQVEFEETEELHDIEKAALILNHSNFYVRTLLENGIWQHQIGYLRKDAHQVELDLLEKHMDVFLGNRGWE